MAKYKELVVYKEQHGHCMVPYNVKPFEGLSQWVKRQKYQYKLYQDGRHSTLTAERIELLNDIGFIWDSHVARWEKKYLELQQFYYDHGHCHIVRPTSSNSKGSKHNSLYVWIKCQRRQRRFYDEGKHSNMTQDCSSLGPRRSRFLRTLPKSSPSSSLFKSSATS